MLYYLIYPKANRYRAVEGQDELDKAIRDASEVLIALPETILAYQIDVLAIKARLISEGVDVTMPDE
jgi:hypothetical protein